MRTITTQTQNAWLSGDYTGPNRPMVRATIQRLAVSVQKYRTQTYASICHGQRSRPRELPIPKSVKWSRSIDGAATMTMVLWNTAPLPVGQAPEAGLFDIPGYYTYLRGKAVGAPWTHETTGWQDWIVPDRLIHTYEGYGYDWTQIPEDDPHLYKSGTWLIDDVTFGDGLITIEARDVGRALLDQVLMPPIVPLESYPLYFDKYHDVDNPDIVETVGGWHRPTYDHDVNKVHGMPSIFGHTASDAFDNDPNSYWLSISYLAPSDPYSYGFIQGKVKKETISGIKFRTWGGPYQAFISVYANGKWQGKQIIPYDPDNRNSLPNGANIPYIKSVNAKKEAWTSVSFPTPIAGVTKIRLSFTNLYDTGKANPYRYRMGLRDFQVSNAVQVTRDGGKHVEPTTSPPGYGDYSDIIKVLLAYAGWHWPENPSIAVKTKSDGTVYAQPAPNTDPALAWRGPILNPEGGRIWGDIETCGTAGEVALGVEIWDKKPVMDGINYVKDLLGYIFFIDEDGAAIFRAPNIWSVGNWIGNMTAGAGRTSDVVTIHEDQTLLNLTAKLSSRSIRERTFVANVPGKHAAMAKGFNPYPSGLRRVGGYTDQHFSSDAECRVMADLITLRQLFTYRTDSVTIPGNPAIQVDDQVRIYERQSEETFLHYVKGISMDWDAETGKYTYSLNTHWLGDHPFDRWTFDPADLSAETQAYLEAMGRWHA